MTRVTLAILTGSNGKQYKLIGWRNGSHETSTPSRPAKLYVLTDEEGWQHLEAWNGAILSGEALGNRPKPDEDVLEEALERLELNYGVTVEKVVLQKNPETNHLGEPLGWGYKATDRPDTDTQIKTISG